jgi:hypothetical protein
MLQKSLIAKTKIYGDNHLNFANTYGNIGIVYH